VIDSYCHCGISKYLPIEEVEPVLDRAGVERAVLVQHLGEYDNGYLASAAAAAPERYTAVGLVDESSPGWREAVSELAAAPEFTGLRLTHHTLLARPDVARAGLEDGLVVMLDAEDGIRDCVEPIRALVGEVGGRFLVSHLGYPTIENGRVTAGRELLELAASPGVYVLFSGFLELCPYPYLPLDGFVEDVVAAFGVDRIVWGSDFPVGGGEEGYLRDLSLIADGRFSLDPEEREAVMERTPAQLWF
jgi:predicted TIM-barrel fold metal-dependent hydrolase